MLYSSYSGVTNHLKMITWKWKSFSCVWVFVTPCNPWSSPDLNTGVGNLSLLQGVFPTQGLNPGLPHCRRILYQLSHQGSPRILEQVAYPFSADLGLFHRGQMDCLLCDSLPRRHFRSVHQQKQCSNRLRRNCNALLFLFYFLSGL